MTVKLGEVMSEMTSEVKKTDDLRVLMMVGWTGRSKEIAFKPSEDLRVGDKIKITVEKLKIMEIKPGEVQPEMTADIKKTEDMEIQFRMGWGYVTTGKINFKPSEDLKKGDKIKITIEKV
jgi:uncharacterized Zn finger protein